MAQKLTKLIRSQFKNNLLSILSLLIALSALTYNSWRNEASELNRNVRFAGFEILKESAQLQLYLDHLTYGNQSDLVEPPIEVWVKIRLIESYSYLMDDSVKLAANDLFSSWESNWKLIMKEESSNGNISAANKQLVNQVKMQLERLN